MNCLYKYKERMDINVVHSAVRFQPKITKVECLSLRITSHASIFTAELVALNLGRTHVTHKYLLSGDSQPLCDKCQCSLTVKHILLECCSLQHVRENYFTCSSLKELFENVDDGFCQRSQLLSSCLVVIVIFPFYISYCILA